MTRRSTRARRLCTGIAVALAVLCSCTTVNRTALVTSSGTSARAGATGSDGTTGTATDDAVAATNGGGTAGGGGGGASAAAGGDPNAVAGSSCAQSVKIGVSYSSDLATGLAIVGNPDAATQTGGIAQQIESQTQVAADDINARGGLAGCKVELVYHDFKSLGADGFSGESQTECADFAEDQHVFAVITGLGGALENATLISCLAQHGVVTIWGAGTGTYTPSEADFAKFRGLLYQPSGIAPDRWGTYIDQLASAGYFPSGAKVGILLADDGTGNNQRLVDNLWKPTLAAMGINPTVFTFTEISGYSQVGSTSSQFSSAVLAFKAAGVDHVIMTSDNANASVFFTQVASSQHYYPRYALNTNNSPATWSTEPSDQTNDALAVTFTLSDLGQSDPSQRTANPSNDARAHCDALYASKVGPNDVLGTYAICDYFAFLQTGLLGAGSVTSAALADGVARLGNTLPIAEGYDNAQFGPDRSDGASATRVMRYDNGSGGWVYVSPPTPIP